MNEVVLQLISQHASLSWGRVTGSIKGLEARCPGASVSHVKQDDSSGLRLKASFGQLYSLAYSRCSEILFELINSKLLNYKKARNLLES